MNIIKQLRRKKGLTQQELGQILNVQKATISKYENGYILPDISTILKLADLFDVSVDFMLGHKTPSTDMALTLKEKDLICMYRELPTELKKVIDDNISAYHNMITKSKLNEEKAM